MPALSFQKQFAPAVESGKKLQTVRPLRKVRPFRVGDVAALYTGMRTKNCRLLGSGDVISVEPIEIASCDLQAGARAIIRVNIGPWSLSKKEREAFAKADGFTDARDMARWFAERYVGAVFRGVLIRWKLRS